jgi:hypothetical protein
VRREFCSGGKDPESAAGTYSIFPQLPKLSDMPHRSAPLLSALKRCFIISLLYSVIPLNATKMKVTSSRQPASFRAKGSVVAPRSRQKFLIFDGYE